ncbi:MAG: hypothetical protein ACOC44_11010 [Promethearchaeia archaeon]
MVEDLVAIIHSFSGKLYAVGSFLFFKNRRTILKSEGLRQKV